MNTLYKDKPLTSGERIPGTSLTFIQPILRRRGEFQCDCGRRVPIDISRLERYGRKTCGCRDYGREE